MNFATQNSKAFAPNDFSRFSDKFESGHRHHVVADVISFATTFFCKDLGSMLFGGVPLHNEFFIPCAKKV